MSGCECIHQGEKAQYLQLCKQRNLDKFLVIRNVNTAWLYLACFLCKHLESGELLKRMNFTLPRTIIISSYLLSCKWVYIMVFLSGLLEGKKKYFYKVYGRFHQKLAYSEN